MLYINCGRVGSSEMTQDPHSSGRQDSGVARADLRGLRGGGLKLPGLKPWRVRCGLTQKELAERVDVPVDYVQRVEQGRRGCNSSVAQKVADALGVDLRELRAGPAGGDDDAAAGAEVVSPGSGGEPPHSHLNSPRYLHQAYLKVLLEREVGSAYLVLDEEAFERHIRSLPVEEVEEVIARRRRELEDVEGVLAGEGAELHPQVRRFLEELVRERPAQDIRVLAMRRAWEPSEEGHERLTQAMRELL
jgi:transcriptional regulator with XRE-family HTH domain